jgi:hypothetical protein
MSYQLTCVMKLLNKLNWKRSSLKAQKVYELKSYKLKLLLLLNQVQKLQPLVTPSDVSH